MTVHSLRTRALLVSPIRLVLGVILLVAARAGGAASGPALLAFVLGGLGIAFLIFNDPRARFAGGGADPLELPADAVVAPGWRQALAATIPSTVGVSLLAVVAVVARPVLGALLAGVCAGLGLASLISLTRIDPRLYANPKTHVVYRSPEVP